MDSRARYDTASILPPESQDRLAALAAMYLRDASATDRDARYTASLVALPMHAISEPRAWRSSEEREAITIPAACRDGEAIAIVPVKDASGLIVEPDLESDDGLALCVSSSAPRDWTSSDLAAIAAVATTAGLEFQLRSEIARQFSVTEKLRENPLHDPVTELANRALFLDRIGQALMRAARKPERQMAVMSLTLEQFPDIERGFGYDVAQEVLKEVAKRLRVAVRNVDSLARLAGNEFGILLEGLRDDSDAARVAARIHEGLRAAIGTRWDEFVVTARIGVVLSTTGLDSPSRLLQLAALARERASTSGTPYELFDPAMQQKAQARLHGEMELRRAIDQGQLELYYQPIISVERGTVARLEALVRWRHPKRGVVGAADFIPLAEQTGLVVSLGWLVLDQACSQLAEWRQQKETQYIPVSINMTAAHLAPDLVERTRTALARHSLPPTALTLEITEGILIDDPWVAKRVIDELRLLGVTIHVDDFGTGYSSLQYLHELPVDAIKIDRKFVARMADGSREGQVAVTIRELARQIGVPVVAEGVETLEQLRRIRSLKCEFAQGFLFSPALPPDDVVAFLESAPRW